jgi:two-component system NtrC family sensor kinase
VPILRSNLARMQQVFMNLINNAVDAVGRGGEVCLSVVRSDGGVEVRVADNGPGILDKDIGRIFEPFFSTKTGNGRHAGLGLAICQEIMHALHGRMCVESRSGKGTIFTLWFPMDPEAE